MQGFYNLSNKIRETLQLDAFVNTVFPCPLGIIIAVCFTFLSSIASAIS